jgi:hypothetical protein
VDEFSLPSNLKTNLKRKEEQKKVFLKQNLDKKGAKMGFEKISAVKRTNKANHHSKKLRPK